ncbi:MAG: cobalamin B12-binding domain-containing protein [Deltaproteobacteria bacterium]|nr:cobalamin B12-binding domain-containing protein [Deltaproteobacteria bacterium]
MGKIRVVVAKLGLDGHDRGARVISRFLRDAGMEVIYTGIRQSPEDVCRVALHEDADLIGVSILSGAHNALVPRLIAELERSALDIPVVVGGIVPDDDIDFLRSKGVRAVFTPGTPVEEIVKTVNAIVEEKRAG